MGQPDIRTRRAFVALAAGLVAVACAPLAGGPPLAAATPPGAPTSAPSGTPAPDPLDAIRAYSFPAQTEPAFLFRARR